MTVTERNYGVENVTVTLEWSNDESAMFTYSVTVVTDSNELNYINSIESDLENSSVLITISYNTLYSVTISANHCGQILKNITELYYGEQCHNFYIIKIIFCV